MRAIINLERVLHDQIGLIILDLHDTREGRPDVFEELLLINRTVTMVLSR